MADVSQKVFQVGAFKLERSLEGALHKGWGKQPPATLTVNDGFPYVSFSNQPTINNKEDDQVKGNAFSTAKVITGRYYEGTLETYEKYTGLNNFYNWLFQWEDKPIRGIIVVSSSDVDLPVVGDVLEDTEATVGTWTVKEVITRETIDYKKEYVFFLTGSDAHPVGTVVFVNTTTAGNDLYVENLSNVTYRHWFTFDKQSRNLRDFTAAERTAIGTPLITGQDQKSPFATFAKRINNSYDFVYPNSICGGFEMKVSAADVWMVSPSVLAISQLRDKVIPEGLLMDCDAVPLTNAPMHYQTKVVAEYTLPNGTPVTKELGVTDISFKAEIPTQKIQTTTSKLGLAEPYLEGLFALSASITVARHSDEDAQELRDANLPMKVTIDSWKGPLRHKLIFKTATVTNAGPNEDEVSAEPLELSIDWDCSDSVFNDIQNSPVIFEVINEDPSWTVTGRQV